MAKASSQQSESKEKTTKSTAKKAPAKKAAPKKETAKAKSAAASKKKAVEAEAAEAHDLEEDDTENILESDVEPTDLHDDHHDVKASDLTDESLLEGVPEEELKAAAEITVPKVSHKSKSTRKRSTRKSSADSSVALLTGDPVRMYLKEIGKVSLLTAAEEIDLAMKIEAGVAATAELEKAEEEAPRAPPPYPCRAGGYRCQAAAHRGKSPLGCFHRKALRWSRHAVPRPYPGRQPGSYPCS